MTGSQTGIVVVPAAAFGFRISAPTSFAKDAPFTIRVTTLHAYGNVATGNRRTVGFRVSAPHPQDALPANYAFTATDKRIHTFTINIKKKGARTPTIRARNSPWIAGSTRVTVV